MSFLILKDQRGKFLVIFKSDERIYVFRIMSTTKYYLKHEYVIKVLNACLHLIWKSLETENKIILKKYKENQITKTLLGKYV